MKSVQFNPEEFNYLRDLAIKETETLEKNIKNQFNAAANQEVLTLNKVVREKLTRLLRSGAYSVTFGGEDVDEVDSMLTEIDKMYPAPEPEVKKEKKAVDFTSPITLEDEDEEE